MKKVILDALGGDHGMTATLDGAERALKKDKTLELVIVGDAQTITERLGKYSKRIEIIHSTTNIGFEEKPVDAIRKKLDSSIVLGLDALKKRDDCVAFVSCGSTGAILTGGFMRLGRINGVSRPALCSYLPTVKSARGVYVVDLGANMDCDAKNLLHFAIMADIYLRGLGIEKPRIGLLSVGTEEEKGNNLTHEAHQLLKSHTELNYLGNMEACDTFSGDYDIVVCDGFCGNVLLKTIEGGATLFGSGLKKALGIFYYVFGLRLLKMKKRMSGGPSALFLGVKKPVMKIHGNGKAKKIALAIAYAKTVGEIELGDKIAKALGENVD